MARLCRFAPEPFREGGNLLLRVLHRAGSVDGVRGVFEFFFVGKLQGDPAARFLFAESTREQTLDLVLGTAINDNEAVEPLVHSSFDEKSGFDENGIGNTLRAPRIKLHIHGGFDARMQNGVQFCEFRAIRENEVAKFFAIDAIIFAKNLFAEFANHIFKRRFARLDQFMTETVRVENVKTEFAQLIRDPAFTAGDSSRETEFLHKKSESKDSPLQRRRCNGFFATEAGGFDGVAHEHSDGHGTDAAWNGSESAGSVYCIGMNIADKDAALFAEF